MARNPDTNQQMKDARREQILEAALKLFSQKGLAATKIADIARSADMAQGLLYHYFGSKENIYIELVRDAFIRINQACQWLEDQPLTGREKIDMAVSSILENLVTSETSPLYHLLVVQATTSQATPEAALEVIREQNRLPYESLARIMAAGQQEGGILPGDPMQLAQMFWIAIKGLALHRIAHEDAFEMPDKSIVLRMFLN